MADSRRIAQSKRPFLLSGRPAQPEMLTGIGVQYQLSKGLGLVLERQSFDLTGGWITLGASWRF